MTLSWNNKLKYSAQKYIFSMKYFISWEVVFSSLFFPFALRHETIAFPGKSGRLWLKNKDAKCTASIFKRRHVGNKTEKIKAGRTSLFPTSSSLSQIKDTSKLERWELQMKQGSNVWVKDWQALCDTHRHPPAWVLGSSRIDPLLWNLDMSEWRGEV